MLQGVYDAWDANDADVFVAEYTEDATAILPGVYRHSREEIRASMEAAFSGPLKGSTTNEVLNVRFLADDIATVVTETGMLFPGEIDAPSDRLVNATWTLVRRNGNWLIAAYQNTPAVANMG